MKKVRIEKFKCEICGELYATKKEALSCESRPILQDKGVKVGDVILITKGEGAGSKGKVTDTMIYDKYWGHYAHERYWHTIGLCADIIGGWGSRQLTFDSYETIKTEKRLLRPKEG